MSKFSLNKKALIAESRDYLMITIGMISYCIGWSIFLLSNEIVLGGVSGISSLIYWVTGIPVQLSYFGINAVLLIFALRILGLKFCMKTIYAVTVLTLAISLCQHFYHGRRYGGGHQRENIWGHTKSPFFHNYFFVMPSPPHRTEAT